MAEKGAKVLSGEDVRRAFLDYFTGKNHTEVKSAPLIPGTDATLLFTNAGMVQFKDVFTGREKRPYSRATSSQKCLRVSGKHNDLETVGRTARHHTFFEMLGNFSFGDYFKENAIEYGWEFMTQTMGLPVEKLYVTVYTDDDEAADIWSKNIGIPADKLSRMGAKDNFWSMGDTGPCGPCSEIHYDRGEEYKCDNPDCGIDCECDRYLELWNLVFMQYDRDSSGKMTPLPNPSIDTGLGLERLVSVIQGKETNFDTDLILPIINHMERFTDASYGAAPETDVSFRVIGDHMRALAFLIADGVMPSNEGRGYVLRRIVRRALRHGKMLGVNEPFAHRLVSTVIEMMQGSYPELAEASNVIKGASLGEEESFGATLEHGMNLLNEIIEKQKSTGASSISGEEAFKLYDTYGFPMDLAVEIAEDAGMTIDQAGFTSLMDTQREKARKSWKGGVEEINPVYAKAYGNSAPTEFTGYTEDSTETEVVSIIVDGEVAESAIDGTEAEILLAATPFYAESGGQVSDTGYITGESFRARVSHVAKEGDGYFFHKVTVESGSIKPGDSVTAKIDTEPRDDTRRNHSATHLLHSALRSVLGGHVKQAGSLVEPGRLRFDYTHFAAPSARDVERLEEMVNMEVLKNEQIATEVKSFDEAQESGAMALFGEKYGEKVRVVSMGDFSTELCGGTHASATGDIGLFRIVSEGGVAAGVRRIEGVTGRGALEVVRAQDDELDAIRALLKSGGEGLADRVKKQMDRAKDLEKENRKLKEKLSNMSAGGDAAQGETTTVGDITVATYDLGDADAEFMRTYIDKIRNEKKSTVAIAGSRAGGKAMLAIGVTKDITARIKAGQLIKEVAAIVGGGGGGRPDFAQAGGKNPEKLEEALKAAPGIVEGLLG